MQTAAITSFLMFQKVIARPFSPHCRARCLFLLSEEIKADHSVQALHELEGQVIAMKACFIMRKDRMLRSREMLEEKELHLRDWKREFCLSFVDHRRPKAGWQKKWENWFGNLICCFLQRPPRWRNTSNPRCSCELKAEAVETFPETIAWRREYNLKFWNWKHHGCS